MSWPRRGLAPWLLALAGALMLHVLVLHDPTPDAPTAQSQTLLSAQRVIPMALLAWQPKPLDAQGLQGAETRPEKGGQKQPATASQPKVTSAAERQPRPEVQLPGESPFSRSVQIATASVEPTQPELVADRFGEDSPSAPSTAALKALPSYPTELPASFTQALQVRRLDPASARGELRLPAEGQGELRFERGIPGAYSLNLSLQWGTKGQLELNSQGHSGVRGLEPERFTDRRRGRSRTAANFDRANQQARFSAGAAPVALAAAAQDRLTWMVQLPAVIRADPSLLRPGAMVWLQVVGARGGSQVWRFESLGPETLQLPDGSTVHDAWHWRRMAEQPYDLQVDAWIAEKRLASVAPAPLSMPARVRLTPMPGGAALEFWPVEVAAAGQTLKRGP